jgi:pilus assembly protein CpaC
VNNIMKTKTDSFLRSLRFDPIAVAIFVAFAGTTVSAFSQSAPAVNTKPDTQTALAESGMDASARNGYAENLRPKTKRPAVFANQPYQPIKKQDNQGEVPEIEMFVGESRVFPAPNVGRIAVGNGAILTAAALDNKEVLLFANGVGTSSLFVWNEDGRYQRVKINIVPGDTSRFAREIAAFLTAIPRTKASIIGDKVIVEGDNLSDADLAKIEELAKRYPQIVNFTNRLGWEKMVMMDVKVVEFPKSELRDIGLKWTAQGGAAVGAIWSPGGRGHQPGLQITIPTGTDNQIPITNADGSTAGIPLPTSLNVLSAINLGLSAQLNLLEQNGKITTLAEPQLSARNGSKASFLAGGEYPYTVSTINGPTVMFKPYGVKLNITPRVDHNGVIRAVVESEVSEIDFSVSTPAGPALSTRQTNTEFNVQSGETIVLSGLLSRRSGTSVDKVPLLGDMPVLGALFRSKRFQNNETELVVFVTPTVIDSQSPGLVDRVQRTKERLQENLGQPPYLSEPLQPGHDPAKTAVVPPTVSASDKQALPPAERNVGAIEPAPVVALGREQAAPKQDASTLKVTQDPFASTDRGYSTNKGGSNLRVNLDGLVLRAEPKVQSEALMQLGRGSVVRMTGADPRDSGGRSWREVTVGELTGWVEAKWVEPSKLNAQLNPFSKTGVAQADRGGMPIGVGNPNIRTEAGKRAPATADLASQDSVGARYRVNLDKLALRVTPDVNAPVVEHLKQGDLVERLPQEGRAYWVPIQANGKRGWAPSQWLIAE